MNKVLVIKELRRNFKIFLIVTLANTGFLMVTLLMYSGMKESMLSVTELYANMPASFMEALNFHEGQWNHILGFYATYVIYYGPLFLGMYSIYLGTSILSKEEYQGTAEFLLAKPITRNEILSSKLIVILIYIFVGNIILWLNGVIWCGADSGFGNTFSQITIIHAYTFFICLFFAAMGLVLTIFMKRAKAIVGPAIGIVMGMYMLDMIIRITDKADFILYLTPFKYLNIDLLNPDYHMEWWRIIVTGSAATLMILTSYLKYKKKDILL